MLASHFICAYVQYCTVTVATTWNCCAIRIFYVTLYMFGTPDVNSNITFGGQVASYVIRNLNCDPLFIFSWCIMAWPLLTWLVFCI